MFEECFARVTLSIMGKYVSPMHGFYPLLGLLAKIVIKVPRCHLKVFLSCVPLPNHLNSWEWKHLQSAWLDYIFRFWKEFAETGQGVSSRQSSQSMTWCGCHGKIGWTQSRGDQHTEIIELQCINHFKKSKKRLSQIEILIGSDKYLL